MRAILRISVLLALCVVGAAAAAAQQPAVDFWIAQRDPGAGIDLATGDGLHMRLGYKSDRPVRFRMEGRGLAHAVTAGVMYGIAPLYPAGEGEALVWIAYRQPGAIDEIAITALDAEWKPLGTMSAAVQIGWDPGMSRRRPAEWVVRLSQMQQEMVARPVDQTGSGGGDSILFLVLTLGVLGYFVLQPLTVRRFDGGWRMAALAPLVLVVPLFLHAVIAFAAGGNLWPLLLILGLPIATLYLLALAGVRMLVCEAAA